MAFINSSMSPLPFYDSMALWNHKRSYAFGQVYGLITYRNMLMPFQFVLSGEGHDTYRLLPRYVILVNVDTGEELRIGTSMIEAGLEIKHYDDDFSVIRYPGILPIASLKEEGRYYFKITLKSAGYPTVETVSEIFTISNNVDDCIQLEYSNSYNFELKNGMVDFSDNFKFRCYLQATIGKPDYEFEEEATERMGYSFMESQVSKKVYHFTFLAPEYLCDALRIVRMCEDKRIISKNKNYELISFSMEPDWQDQGDLAAVECSFETDTVIANIGGYTPKLLGGDFNPDYNKDFDDIHIGPEPGPDPGPDTPDIPDVPEGDNLVTAVTQGSWGAVDGEDRREFTPTTYPNSEYSRAFYHTNLIACGPGDVFKITIPNATGTIWMCCYNAEGVATMDAYTIGINQQITMWVGTEAVTMGFNIKVEDLSYIKSDLFTVEQAKAIIITKEN